MKEKRFDIMLPEEMVAGQALAGRMTRCFHGYAKSSSWNCYASTLFLNAKPQNFFT